MDYPCAKFGGVCFSCFGFIVRTNTHRHIHRQKGSHTDAAIRFTPAIIVSVTNELLIRFFSRKSPPECKNMSSCTVTAYIHVVLGFCILIAWKIFLSNHHSRPSGVNKRLSLP